MPLWLYMRMVSRFSRLLTNSQFRQPQISVLLHLSLVVFSTKMASPVLSNCYVCALTVMEVNTLQVEAKATHHVAKRQRQTLPHVIPMTKGKAIQ